MSYYDTAHTPPHEVTPWPAMRIAFIGIFASLFLSESDVGLLTNLINKKNLTPPKGFELVPQIL